MDEQEHLRLLNLLNSVEKEEREEERRTIEHRNLLRRDLFAGAENTFTDDEDIYAGEEPIERDGSDESNDEAEESDHETGSETSLEDTEERNREVVNDEVDESSVRIENIVHEPVEGDNQEVLDNVNAQDIQSLILGKDKKTKWDAHVITRNLRSRVRRHNIIRAERIGVRLPSPKGIAKNMRTPYDTWKLFFPDEFVDKIVQYTNIWIERNRANYSRIRDARNTDRVEMHALFGLLFLAGMLRSSHTNLEELWAADGLGIDYFRCTMNIKRFKFLLRAIRFDDIRTRHQRKAQDKAAAIRDVFQEFVQRCQEYYSVSEYVTVDEMLEAFRGRCGFRQYIPNKPARYGIKLFALCDARTFYTSNLEIYAGKQPEGPYKLDNSAKAVTLRMIAPISGTGRHLTIDNWYGSIPLAKELLHNHRLTVVSTLKKNKPEIPPCFVEKKSRTECSSLFVYQNDTTLLSYVPKKNKVVLLLSTYHHTDEIDEETGDKCKPLMLTCYNKYKGGVDTVDQMKSAYSVSRKSNRWSLTVFFSIMNITSINSYIILRDNIGPKDTGDRRYFIRLLGKELCLSLMNRRASIPTLPMNLRSRIKELCGVPARAPAPQEIDEDNLPSTGRCYLCARQQNRKSRTRCPRCKFFVCREHTSFSCRQCANGNEGENNESESE